MSLSDGCLACKNIKMPLFPMRKTVDAKGKDMMLYLCLEHYKGWRASPLSKPRPTPSGGYTPEQLEAEELHGNQEIRAWYRRQFETWLAEITACVKT